MQPIIDAHQVRGENKILVREGKVSGVIDGRRGSGAGQGDEGVMRFVLTLLLMLVAASAWAGPMEDAVAANERGDYAAELRITRPLAAKGEAWAQFFIGLKYHEGQGVVQDYVEAIKWYRLAAAQGEALAQNNLGVMYGQGWASMSGLSSFRGGAPRRRLQSEIAVSAH